jgi:hypothetical protein
MLEAIYIGGRTAIKEFWKSFNVLDSLNMVKQACITIIHSNLEGEECPLLGCGAVWIL